MEQTDLREMDDRNENRTIDVARKGCFGPFDPVACVRSGILSFTVLITVLLCVVRVVELHLKKHPQLHHYFVFYVATFECIISCAYWASGAHYPQVDFALSYLKLLQFVVICHFYWSLVTRILHKEGLIKRVIVPILSTYFGYFTIIAALGISDPKSSWIECFEPEWLFLSAAEFLAVQLFAVAGVYITKKLNQISSDDAFKVSQKRDLWSVIVVYETSALVSLTYDTTMKLFGDNEIGCSGIFGHAQISYSVVYALFMTVKFLMPVWVLLCVFHPSPSQIIDHESIFGWSFDGTASTSVFRSQTGETPYCRQLRFPVGDGYATQPTCGVLSSEKGDNLSSSPVQGCTAGYVKHLQSTLAPITEEDVISESLSSERSSILESGHLNDNQPLIKRGGCGGANGCTPKC